MARTYEVLVCIGGDCRRSPGFTKVCAMAADCGPLETVACQGHCSGPVVGLRDVEGGLRWYGRVRGDRRRALRRVVRTGRGRSVLRDAEVRRLRGRLRRPGRRRVLPAA